MTLKQEMTGEDYFVCTGILQVKKLIKNHSNLLLHRTLPPTIEVAVPLRVIWTMKL